MSRCCGGFGGIGTDPFGFVGDCGFAENRKNTIMLIWPSRFPGSPLPSSFLEQARQRLQSIHESVLVIALIFDGDPLPGQGGTTLLFEMSFSGE